MKIIGLNFEKISVERKNPIKSKLEISSNINIKEIKQEKIDIVKEQNPLKFNFKFTIEYKPKIAELIFEGFILALFEKTQSKEIIKKWKNKKISDDIRIPLFNFILTKCNIKALQFEEEFGLPTHLPLPRIKPQPEKGKANYTG